MTIQCCACGKPAHKTMSALRRTQAFGHKLYCSTSCAIRGRKAGHMERLRSG